MEFKALTSPGLRDLFVERLGEMIVSGRLKPGDTLPSERELAEQMGVSRAVINGGLAELARMGFVAVTPRRGTVVADRRKSGSLDTLAAELVFSGGALSDGDRRSLVDLLKTLALVSVRGALGEGGSPQLDTLGDALIATTYAERADGMADAAFAFLHALALAGKNSVLPLVWRSLQPLFCALMTEFCETAGGGERIAHAAEVLCACLCDRDLEAAERWVEVCFERLSHEPGALLDG